MLQRGQSLADPLLKSWILNGVEGGLQYFYFEAVLFAPLREVRPETEGRVIRRCGKKDRFLVILHVANERQDAVIIALTDRIEHVVMAARAIDREAKERLAGGGDDFIKIIVSGLAGIIRLV